MTGTPSDSTDQSFEVELNFDGERPRPLPTRRQILALSGGGFRGLYSATVLACAEAEFKCSIGRYFDLLVGTSIGALIAAGLASGTSAATIAAKIECHGPKIFPRVPYWTAVKKTFVSAPYSAENVAAAVIDTIGEQQANRSLAEIDKPLAINAVNYTYDRPETFRSYGLAGNAASKVSLLDAVLASAAAPTYFPPKVVGGEQLIDGGLIANAPELVGISEACERLAYSLDSLYVLAIGTAARRQGASLTSIGRPGAFSWIVHRGLVQTTMAAQEALAVSQCKALMKSRYLRIDAEPLQEQVAAIKDLDYASKLAAATLKSLANSSWTAQKDATAFRNFFGQ